MTDTVLEAKEEEADAKRRAALAAITAACEEAYADASREGYADNSAVVAAVANLKTAHAALVAADANFTAAAAAVTSWWGVPRATLAVWRADRANLRCDAAFGALRHAIMQVGEQHLLNIGFGPAWIAGVKALAQVQK